MTATVTFGRVFTGNYATGQPYDVVTVSPSGTSETFADMGITIRVSLKNCDGQPLVGIPAEEIVLFHSGLCICPGGNIADAPTDAQGRTSFSRALRAGGCASDLWVFADGIAIAVLPVKTNSPDAIPASPCHVDASDVPSLAAKLGTQVGGSEYSICFDYNEDGYIDAGDLASFASHLPGLCP